MNRTDISWDGVVDPVCGREVTAGGSKLCCRYKERQYYFCSDACCGEFVRRAQRFRLQELAAAGALMHTSGIRTARC